MKLVYRIVLHLAWVLSLLLAAWAVLFYFAQTDRIDRETDDSLEARAETAIKQFLSGRALPDSGSGNDGCALFRTSTPPCGRRRFTPTNGFIFPSAMPGSRRACSGCFSATAGADGTN